MADLTDYVDWQQISVVGAPQPNHTYIWGDYGSTITITSEELENNSSIRDGIKIIYGVPKKKTKTFNELLSERRK